MPSKRNMKIPKGASDARGFGMGKGRPAGGRPAPQPQQYANGYVQGQANTQFQGQVNAGYAGMQGQGQANSQYYAASQPNYGQTAQMPYASYAQQQNMGAGVQAYAQSQVPGAQNLGAQAVGVQNPGAQTPGMQNPYQTLGAKKKRGAGFWIAIVAAIVCLVVAALLVLSMCDGGASRRVGDEGQLEGKSTEEIQAELDRTVEDGMFNISIASIIEFADGKSNGDVRIENVPGNPYLMQVVITLADTGQQVYESGILEPNHHIQSDSLDVDLPAGTYPAIATFTALDPQTEEEVGQAAAKLTIVVQS